MNGWERRNFLEIEINSFFFFESKLSSFILKGINFWNYEEKEMLLTKLLILFPPIFENVHVETIWTNDGARSRE